MDDFEQYRPLLFSIAYRMLGSVMDAEDLVQEAYLRYQAVPTDEVRSPKAYLATIATRLALNQLTSARAQRETYLGPWLPEPLLGADQLTAPGAADAAHDDESISMAFMVLLESLTPPERAVFVLREVFDFSYPEIAAMLDKSEAACRQLFSRARSYLAAHRPRFEASREAHQRLMEQFVATTADGDLDGLINLLAEDAVFWADGGGKARGAATHPVRGREAVARFVLGVARRFTPPGADITIAEVNGLPALLVRDADGAPAFVVSIAVGRGRIHDIWATANPDKLRGLDRPR